MTDGPRLVMSQGPQPGETFPLDKETLNLGRDPANDIVIGDPQVSRQHARISRRGELRVIEDLGSTNGTFINGMRLVGPHTLADGDEISLGDAVSLTYYGEGPAAAETLAGRPTVAQAPTSYEPPPAYVAAPPPSPGAPPVHAAAPSLPPVETPAEERGSRTWLWWGCGCLVLLTLACLAAGLFAWYAPASFWQALIDLGIPVPTWPF